MNLFLQVLSVRKSTANFTVSVMDDDFWGLAFRVWCWLSVISDKDSCYNVITSKCNHAIGLSIFTPPFTFTSDSGIRNSFGSMLLWSLSGYFLLHDRTSDNPWDFPRWDVWKKNVWEVCLAEWMNMSFYGIL